MLTKKEIFIIVGMIFTVLTILFFPYNLNDDPEPTDLQNYPERRTSPYWKMDRGTLCRDFTVRENRTRGLATLCFSEHGMTEIGTFELSDSAYTEQVLPVRKELIRSAINRGIVDELDWWFTESDLN